MTPNFCPGSVFSFPGLVVILIVLRPASIFTGGDGCVWGSRMNTEPITSPYASVTNF